MKLKTALLVLSFVLPCAAASAQQAITLATEDGWSLSANYYPSKNGKAVVLLHDAEKTKADFATFSQKLAQADYGVIALDLRGHGQSTNLGVQKDFKKTGTDNDYNRMVRDVDSAVAYLKTKGVSVSNIYLLGAGLGANIAAKSLLFNQSAAGLIMLTPSLKSRDVLTMSGLKVFKNPVLIAVSAEDRKAFMEASFIRNAAFLSSGENKVTFLTAYEKSGTEMLDKYLSSSVIQWLATPALPEVKPDAVQEEDAAGVSETPEEPLNITLPEPSVLTEEDKADNNPQPAAANTVKVNNFDVL